MSGYDTKRTFRYMMSDLVLSALAAFTSLAG